MTGSAGRAGRFYVEALAFGERGAGERGPKDCSAPGFQGGGWRMTGSAGRAGPLHFECFSLSLTNEVIPTGLGSDARGEAGG